LLVNDIRAGVIASERSGSNRSVAPLVTLRQRSCVAASHSNASSHFLDDWHFKSCRSMGSHDMRPREKLVPGGILEPFSGKVKQLVINMDNGPECNGRQSQFLYRMTVFADMTGLDIRLIYYPPPDFIHELKKYARKANKIKGHFSFCFCSA
jgi:hypothetical protein